LNFWDEPFEKPTKMSKPSPLLAVSQKLEMTGLILIGSHWLDRSCLFSETTRRWIDPYNQHVTLHYGVGINHAVAKGKTRFILAVDNGHVEPSGDPKSGGRNPPVLL